jgi:hypothetical protein
MSRHTNKIAVGQVWWRVEGMLLVHHIHPFTRRAAGRVECVHVDKNPDGTFSAEAGRAHAFLSEEMLQQTCELYSVPEPPIVFDGAMT